MGERKGQNKYYPPDYDPKKGGLNKWQGTHALRERARKLHLGILIIRFEMPFNVWCDGCGNHVGMGVRYNAEKKKVGMYYTTPVYEFKMKCHLCTNHFIIRTDPKNFDYELVEGLRRQEKRWDMTANEQIASTERETSKKLATDAMFKLEHGKVDLAKSKDVAPELQRLETFQQRWKDDFARNQELRKIFRASKREAQASDAADTALLQKSSLNIKLVPENVEDARLATLFSQYKTAQTSDEKQQSIIEELDKESVFSHKNTIKNCLSKRKLRNGNDGNRLNLVRNAKLALEHEKTIKLDKDLKLLSRNLVSKRPKLSDDKKNDGSKSSVTESEQKMDEHENSIDCGSKRGDLAAPACSSLSRLNDLYKSSSDSESIDNDH